MVYLAACYSNIHLGPDDVAIEFKSKMSIDFKVGRTGPIIHYLYIKSG